MSDLNRIKQLAGILTESAMAVPGIDEMMDHNETDTFESEADMQTVATNGVNNADAEFDAAQPQVTEEYDHVGFIKQSIADNHPVAMSDDQLKKKVGIETGYGKDPRFDEYFKKAFDSFYGLDIHWGDADNEDDGYTDYTMRQGEMGNPDKMFNNESMMENSELEGIIQQSTDRLSDMLNSFVNYSQAVNTLVQELQGAGHSKENIEEILNGVNAWFDEGGADATNDNEGDGHCHTCDGTGEGQYDGARCSACGGSGVLHSHDSEDFNEPNDFDERMEEGIELGDPSLGMPAYYIINGHTSAVSAGPFNSYGEAISSSEAKRLIMGGSHVIEYGMEDEDGQFTPADINESFDLNNGYDDIKFMNPGDFFPDGADSPVTSATGPSGALQGDNDEQKKMAVAEAHKELVYNYRKFLKESSKK